jgi:N6-adenosine-specific RNA methylase IME4
MVGTIGTVVSIVGVGMIPFPDKKYNIIYADPAWSFKTYSDKGKDRSPDKHYSVMSLQDIKDLPVQDIVNNNCILFLWVTFPLLKEGFEVIDAWGFTYKTVAFNWVKKNKKTDSWFWGLGYWTRSNAELCLLATKGTIKRQSASIHQIIDTPIERHSKKPDIVRDKIIQLVGDLPRIELFARETADGWDSWGNEL